LIGFARVVEKDLARDPSTDVTPSGLAALVGEQRPGRRYFGRDSSMKSPHRGFVCALLVLLASGPAAAYAQAPPTVWHFLGIPQGWSRFRDGTANRFGNRPNKEVKPPLKALADPANLKSDVPAIKAAAEIKAQQDLAPQKIKAIKYLAMIGCGCYGGVAEALQAALEDCVEEVRFAAAEALGSAMGNQCEFCQRSCCTPELSAKMYERAYGQDENGCFLEPSDRVRAALARVVALCPPESMEVLDGLPPPVFDTVPGTQPLPPVDGGAASPLHFPGGGLQVDPLGATTGTRGSMVGFSRFAPPVAPAPTVPVNVHGHVIDAAAGKGFVRVVFNDHQRPPVGTVVDVYHAYLLGTERVGTLVIRDWDGHQAIAAPRVWDDVKIARGDHVECVMHVPAEVPTPSAPPALPQAAEEQTVSIPIPAKSSATPSVAAESPPTPAEPSDAAEPSTVTARSILPPPPVAPVVKAPPPAATTTPPKFTRTSRPPLLKVPVTKSTTAESSPARSPAPLATAKALPSSRPAPTRVAAVPAPIVKPSDMSRAQRSAPHVAPVTQQAAPVAQVERAPTKSGTSALSEMLRLPAVEAPSQGTPSQAPITAVPIVRPRAGVVPASANLPASGIERLPPVIEPSRMR
jgi:hypothetical protein